MQCATFNAATNGADGMYSAALRPGACQSPPKLSSPTPQRLPSKVAREDEPLLVSAAKSGDAAAFEELVNRYESQNLSAHHEHHAQP